MASLMEELLSVMEQENEGYEKLLVFSEEKKQAVIKSKISELEAITASEQETADILKSLESKRTRILKDMSVVMGKDSEMLTVTQIIDLLDKQPAEQEKLRAARDVLVQTAHKMHVANEQNENLIRQALEMVEYDLTLIKSLKQAPETANYGRNAYSTGELLGSSGFDAKQ